MATGTVERKVACAAYHYRVGEGMLVENRVATWGEVVELPNDDSPEGRKQREMSEKRYLVDPDTNIGNINAATSAAGPTPPEGAPGAAPSPALVAIVADMNVPQVRKFVAANPNQLDAVVAAERTRGDDARDGVLDLAGGEEPPPEPGT